MAKRPMPPQKTAEPKSDGREAPAPISAPYLSAVGRQIKRPVNGVLAIAELLMRQPLPEDAQAHVRSIIEQSLTALQTIEDVCDLARAEAGELTIEAEPFSPREMMDELQTRWQAKAAQNGVALLVSHDGEDLRVLADGRRIAQIFDHLIEHGMKLTRRGGVEASLKIRRSGDAIMVEGSVRDSGAGLPPERLARIFEPCLTAADGDMGLGLALTRKVIEAMHGTIRAESNVGAGSTITFGLIAPEAQAVRQEGDDQPVAVRNAHVLVVDDNATNRMVAEALCEMFDCTSESAEDGLEAVEAAKSGRFDLILMDIKMPRMDGVQATRTIRELPGAAGMVPIIALTANADPEDARGYIASGMSSVVEKPIKAEALLAAMTACLPDAAERADAAAAA